MGFRTLLLSVVSCATCITPAFADEELLADDLFTEISILSDAEIYYMEHNLHYPLEDVLSIESPEAVVDSASAILTLFPKDDYALQCRAIANYQLGKYRESTEDALKILCSYNNSESAEEVILAVAYKDSDMVIDLLKPYTDKARAEQATEDNSLCNSKYLSTLGSIYVLKGNRKEGYRVVKTAYDKYKDEPMNAVYLSTFLLKSGHAKEALDVLKPYIDKDIDDIDLGIFRNYVTALRNSGRVKEAKKLLEKEMKYDPYMTSHQYDYANLLAATGEYKKAKKIYDQIIEESGYTPENLMSREDDDNYFIDEIILRKGIVNCIEGNTEEGHKDIRMVLLCGPTAPNFSGLEHTCYAWLGEKETAIDFLNQMECTEPSSYAAIYAITGDYPTAIKYLKESFDTFENCPEQIEYDLNFKRLREQPEYLELVKSYQSMDLK